MRSALKASECQALLDQIDAIYARARSESSRAQYGEALLEQISQYLTRKYGSGFSPTNLKYMRQFYVACPIRQPAGESEWPKYCILRK